MSNPPMPSCNESDSGLNISLAALCASIGSSSLISSTTSHILDTVSCRIPFSVASATVLPTKWRSSSGLNCERIRSLSWSPRGIRPSDPSTPGAMELREPCFWFSSFRISAYNGSTAFLASSPGRLLIADTSWGISSCMRAFFPISAMELHSVSLLTALVSASRSFEPSEENPSRYNEYAA